MAKTTMVNMPVDVPAEIGGGLTQVESDFFADPSPSRGFMVGFDGSTEIGARKGNRAATPFPVPRPDGVSPFKNLRGGR